MSVRHLTITTVFCRVKQRTIRLDGSAIQRGLHQGVTSGRFVALTKKRIT